MTLSQKVLEKVQKPLITKERGGDFPFNSQYQTIADKYVPVGVILEKFFGIEGASKDPAYQYIRDPFFFQWRQTLQAEKDAAMAQAQAAGGPKPGASPDIGGRIQAEANSDAASQEAYNIQGAIEGNQAAGQQINATADSAQNAMAAQNQVMNSVAKSEKAAETQKRLSEIHKKAVDSILEKMKKETAMLVKQVKATVEQ